MKDWSIFELTAQSSLAAGTIYGWYNQKRKPTLENLKAVCDALEVSLSQFFAANSIEANNAYQDKFYEILSGLNDEQKDALLSIAKTMKGK